MEDLDKLSYEYSRACEEYKTEYEKYLISQKALGKYADAKRKAAYALDQEVQKRYYHNPHKVDYELN